MPKVSVVIPCYNQGRYLDEAVSSVLGQSFTDFETLIVNDGSNDPETCSLLASYGRPKTRVIHTENGGVSAARNRGINEAGGEYILPLDADDRIAPSYLEQAVTILDRCPAVGIVYGEAEFFGARSGPMSLPSYSPFCILWENSIFSAAVFRKEGWQRAGGYRPVMRQGWEDWDFWLTMTELGLGVVRLPEVVLQYRIRPNSRDRALRLHRKCLLLAAMIAHHPKLYLRNGGLGLAKLVGRRLWPSKPGPF